MTRPSALGLTQLATWFENPPAEFRPMVFWIWNGDLNRDEISRQIRSFRAHGLGGFFVHPMGERFRLHDFIRGMSPPYLSPEYFALVRHATETAQREGLYLWLYDEGGWPSGSAQGQVIAGRRDLRRLVLTVEHEPDPTSRPLHQTAAGGRQLYFYERPGGPHPDLLNPEAVARFIQLTHEQYARCVGEFFGTTIPGMFTDEPSVGAHVGSDCLPWTPRLPDEFARRTGRELAPLLPLLFSADALGFDPQQVFSPQEVWRARIAFCDLWTDLFHEAYWRQLNDWCAAHNLLHTGHVGGEDHLETHATAGFGHFFKTAGSLHAPGVDVIWRQVFPGRHNEEFPQLAASARHLVDPSMPRPDTGGRWENLTVSESFAVYSFGLTFEQMRWVTQFQFVRGITMLAPMAYYYTLDGGRLYGTMSHLGEGNPLWDHWPDFSAYVGRLSLFCRQRAASPRAGLLYPIEALWAEGDARRRAQIIDETHEIAAALVRAHVPFAYVDARHARTDPAGTLLAAPSARPYYAACDLAPQPRELPESVQWCVPTARECGALRSPDLPARADQALRVAEFELPGGRAWLLVSEADRPLRLEALRDHLLAEHRATALIAWDPESGRRFDLVKSPPPELAPGAAVVWTLGSSSGPIERLEGPPSEVVAAVTGDWTLTPVESFVLDERHMPVRRSQDLPSPCRLARLQAWEEVGYEAFAGTMAYETTVSVSARQARAAVWLDLGLVRHVACASVNGEQLGSRLWPPYCFALQRSLRAGPNRLRVAVTNTLSGQVLRPDMLAQAAERGWRNAYVERAEPMMREALPSGLLGPVRLLAGAGA